ncbi:MAG: glyceraldehyde-3-phosphate dehydrogenase, partial [Halomonas sp.]
MSQQALENVFQEWQGNEALAEQMIPLVGQLYRQNNVVATMFGRSLIKRSVIRILKDHRFVRKLEGTELLVEDTYPIVKGMVALNLGPAHVDVGKLAVMFKRQDGGDVETFLRKELHEIIDGYQPGASTGEPQDVVLYGFGRIGRLLARVMVEKAGGGNLLRLRAIVVRGRGDVAKDLEKRASLLRRDSVHGPFDGTIMVDAEARTLTVNGNVIQVIYADSPSEVDYTEYDIHNAVIVDNTGIWRDEEGLGQHLKCKGAAKALLTAPGKGDIKNIVYGINHESIGDSDLIVSAASCTTNAIVPVLKVLNDEYGVVNGHVETVHAYT